jgi:hypothetical protein
VLHSAFLANKVKKFVSPSLAAEQAFLLDKEALYADKRSRGWL